MNNQATVYVVDDDKAMRDSLRWLLESAGMKVQTFDNAQVFLDQFDAQMSGCALVDVRMPGMSGLELHRAMVEKELTLPVIVITGHGDISMAVQAMKNGAFDFVEKPFDDRKLLNRITEAIDTDNTMRQQLDDIEELVSRIESLSPREHEVMELVVDGHLNKQIATELDITDKTVESHRAAVMRKMKATSAVELVRMVLAVSHAPNSNGINLID